MQQTCRALILNLRRAHYDIATEAPPTHRAGLAFEQLVLTTVTARAPPTIPKEPAATSGRLIHMRVATSSTIAAGILMLVGCGAQSSTATIPSGVTGLVHLGPQCPVETVGDPCEDQPAPRVTVTVSEQIPGGSYTAGKVVATTTTDTHGGFRVDVPPGDYMVTPDAGMFCEPTNAHVIEGSHAEVDILCDTGIR